MSAKPATVAGLGERDLIRRIARITGPAPRGVVGIGDDAAVVPVRGTRLAATTDALIEGTHFRRVWSTPQEAGAKAMAVNLSDLAAMGAVPEYALVALALPGSIPVCAVEGLYRGLCRAARRAGVRVVGGNVARAEAISITVTLWGRPVRRALLRDGARPGDRVFVTGQPGLAAAGLALLERYGKRGPDLWRSTSLRRDRARRNAALGAGWKGRARRRFLEPEARPRLVHELVRLSPSAVIDTSDGVVRDGARLAARVVLDAAALRPSQGFETLCRELGFAPLERALHGGEDYDLLFALPPRRAVALRRRGNMAGVAVREIGRIEAGAAGVFLEDGGVTNPVTGGGYRHFER